MRYINAERVLPRNLLEEIQKHIEGEYLYIPASGTRKAWGENSGGRDQLAKRNAEITEKFWQGYSRSELAKEYYLSEASIRRVIRNTNYK